MQSVTVDWGVLIWGDILNWISWLGIAVILVSGCATTYYNALESAVLPGGASKQEADPIASEL